MNTRKRVLSLAALFALFASVASVAHGGNEHNNPEIKLTQADQLVGYDVFDPQGEKLGDISDFVLYGSEDPVLQYVLLSSNGIIPATREERAVPAGEIHWDAQKERYVADIHREDYLAIPYLSAEKVGDDVDAVYVDPEAGHVDIYFVDDDVVTSVWEPYDDVDAPEITAEDGHYHRLIADLMEHDVVTGNNDDVGTLTTGLINLDHGILPYLLVRSEDIPPFQRHGPPHYAIPLEDFAGMKEGQIHLTTSSSELENADDGFADRWHSARRGTVYTTTSVDVAMR